MNDQQLVSVEELNIRLGDDAWRIIDCRFDLSDSRAGRKNYESGHIPGAGFADLNEDLAATKKPGTGRHPLPSVESAAAVFSRLGIDHRSTVVVYDGANGAMAARTWWMLRWLGHDSVRLLNGGLAAWTERQYPLETGNASIVPRAFEPKPRNNLIVTTEELVHAGAELAGRNLLDARDRARFRGDIEPIDTVAGHIPGARNMPFLDSLDGDGFWKSREQRRELWLRQLGTDPSTGSIAMCGSGVTACHLILSAVDAGFCEPRLYVGSWSEWITDPGRPIELGEA